MTKLSTRNLALYSMFLALTVVLPSTFIPISGSLRIYVTFIPTMIVASVFDLPMCLLFGFLSDIIGFIAFPSGTFFFGYTLSSILSMLIYWLFLNKEVKVVNIAAAKTIVNLLVNVLLGSLWNSILLSKGFMYYVSTSIVKNLTLLPIEIIVFYLIYQALDKTGVNNKINNKESL